MFTHHRTQALILEKRDIGEADQIITFYTLDFGKVSARGRSIRKGGSKLKMNASLFSLVEIEIIQGKNFNTLTDVILISSFQKAKKSLAKLSLLYRISETTLKLIHEQEKDEKIFSLLLNTFQEIESQKLSKENLKIIWCRYSFQLLYFLGYRVYTKECIFCNKKIEKDCYFSPKEKGAVCKECFSKKPTGIYLKDVNILRTMISGEKEEAFQQDANNCINLLECYLKFIPAENFKF
jgi:DNA repair protein RecO (recombination protein O)